MAQLAIKGHKTRGNEVIEILEMLGGKNTSQYFGDDDDAAYSIEGHEIVIYELEAIKNDDFIVFTLEEFLEKYPYKVGDKVKAWVKGYYGFFDIQDMAWYCVSKEIKYRIYECCWLSIRNLQPYKEETTEETDTMNHTSEINLNHPAFKGCNEIELIIPNGWEFERRGDKMFGVRKYPKTYEECIGLLPINWDGKVKGYKCELLIAFQKLLICRDAYWKTAGEQMGLGKPWEPDWVDDKQQKFFITTFNSQIELNLCATHSYVIGRHNHILAFPTEEMQDAFYESFKELIEECKEFL